MLSALTAVIPFDISEHRTRSYRCNLVGGTTAGLVDELASVGATLPWMTLLTGVSTFVLLFGASGSVVLPLKAIVMNILSLSATLGVVLWIFQWGHLSRPLQFTPTGSIDPTMPILMLAIIFGLSMDYEVFLLSRIRERYDQADGAGHGLPGLFPLGTVATAARPGAAARPHEE